MRFRTGENRILRNIKSVIQSDPFKIFPGKSTQSKRHSRGSPRAKNFSLKFISSQLIASIGHASLDKKKSILTLKTFPESKRIPVTNGYGN